MDAGNFTEDEKRFVLAEYIKASQVDTEQLVEFIKKCNLQPDWFSMQLPGGRNMHQCMRAASSMLDTDLSIPTVPSLKKRKSSDLLQGEQPQKRLASMPHVLYQPRPPSQSQAQTPPLPQRSPQLPHQISIQPRPPPDAKQPIAEGYGVFQSKTPSNGYNVFQSNPAGRKRGRPSKAEKEAQARANASSLVSTGPVPISPKPAIQATGQGAPTPPLPVSAPSYKTYASAASAPSAPSATSADSRDPRGGVGGQKLPSLNAYQEYPDRPASSINSEKSPSIGNLVTSDSPADTQPRGDPAHIGTPHSRDPPVPVTNPA
ncbi:hypothetical protein N0V82_008969 [Gnomoniopsis sp. IMI 355080]|nr:hypothetical protein N0V82_008969 [Gnomoniopsis sp. IMI 355080]